MTVVLGLGNPGDRYAWTRHNVGFRVLDRIAARAGARFEPFPGPERLAWEARVDIGDTPVALVKPRTYMNRSGRAALAACRRFDAAPEELLVVHDDADLAVGRLRLRSGGGAGGHNGIRSLLDVLRTDAFGRVKLGVRGEGRDEMPLADYVLEEFAPAERTTIEAVIDLAAEAVVAVMREGFAAAMNRFNGSVAGAAPP